MVIFDWPLYENMHAAFLAVFAFIGATLGSFFNVLAQRWATSQIAHNDEQSRIWMALRGVTTPLPEPVPGKPLFGGRSSCPKCGVAIPIYCNIPILSWIMLLGKARCCREPIAFRYLAFELTGAMVFATLGYLIAPSMYALVIGILVMILLLIAVIDMQDGLIPDGLLLTCAGLAYLLTTHDQHWIRASTSIEYHLITLVSVFAFFALLAKLAGKGVIGGADQHLLGISAAIQGPVFVYTIPVLVVGLLMTALAIKSGTIRRGLFAHLVDAHKSVPAGPAICLSITVGMWLHIFGVSR